mmetsp:Transcript_1796/g.4771  ORF Transcript_1796/g.4771 Transcript_1796/m.4771 type:complete len:301 (-) Transcript_1796:631-1533(-)
MRKSMSSPVGRRSSTCPCPGMVPITDTGWGTRGSKPYRFLHFSLHWGADISPLPMTWSVLIHSQRYAATAWLSYAASPTELQAARRRASDWSAMWAGMIPGESRSSNSFPRDCFLLSSERTRIHWRERVTPGVFAVRARRRPRILLIRADLPTLGYPITPTLRGRSFSPLLALRSFTCAPALNTARLMPLTPAPRFASTNSTSSTWDDNSRSSRICCCSDFRPPFLPPDEPSPADFHLFRSLHACRAAFRTCPSTLPSHLPAPSSSYAFFQLPLLAEVTASACVNTTTRGRPALHSATLG